MKEKRKAHHFAGPPPEKIKLVEDPTNFDSSLDRRLAAIESALKAIVESLRPNTYRTQEAHAMRSAAIEGFMEGDEP